MNEEGVEVTLLVVQILDSLGIPYAIVRSLASSIYGLARSTFDVDLLADIQPKHISDLRRELESEFYVSEEEIREALRQRSSANIIHFATVFKIDLFVPKDRSFDKRQLENRHLLVLAKEPDRSAYVASAEDTILAKLEWYRSGNEVSDRQWLDILGIIRMRGHQLDIPYLREGAKELKVLDLLEHALDSIPKD